MSVWACRRIGVSASEHVVCEATNGTNGTYGNYVSPGLAILVSVRRRRHTPIRRFAPAAAGPIRRFGGCSYLSRLLAQVCHLS
jgi:hypothetical protein